MQRLLLFILALALTLMACGDDAATTTAASSDSASGASRSGAGGSTASVTAPVDDAMASPGVADTLGGEDTTSGPRPAGSADTLTPPQDVSTPREDSVPTPDAAPEPDAEVIEAPDASRPPTAVDTEEPDEEAVLLGGGVLIFELASEFLDQAGAGARFTDAVSLIDPNAESYGPCVVTDSDPNAPPETPAWGYDAGVISVSGTSPEVVLSPVADTATGTGYESGLSESLETLLPATGALLTVSGAGGADIPAFVGYLQVPAPVNLSSPQTGLFEGVPASSDLTISWNAGGGDTALVTLTPMSQTFQALAGKGLVCTVEGDPGSMIVPKAALQVLKSSGVSKVALGVTRMQTSVTNAGGWGLPLVLTRSTGGPLGLD